MVTLFWSVWAALALVSGTWGLLFLASRGFEGRAPMRGDGEYTPFVTIQIPVFNDSVAAECVALAQAIDYPKDRFEIVIADDSTDSKVRDLLASLATEDAPRVRHLHRPSRRGFKPGALADALAVSRGEILVVFDSDWRPRRSFLREVVPYFRAPDLAIVQTREDVLNASDGLVTRFAASVIWTHYRVVMRAFDRAGITFFCGTAGALRRSALEAVGGWNERSITEDADLSLRLLRAGWTSVLVEHDTDSQVPRTMRAFLAQQARWAYGNARVAMDDASVFFDARLGRTQRVLIACWLFAHVASIATVASLACSLAMTIVGSTSFEYPWWGYLPVAVYLGPCVAGSLWERGRLRDLPFIALGMIAIGIPLAFVGSWQVCRAVLNRPMGWTRTPKQAGRLEASA